MTGRQVNARSTNEPLRNSLPPRLSIQENCNLSEPAEAPSRPKRSFQLPQIRHHNTGKHEGNRNTLQRNRQGTRPHLAPIPELARLTKTHLVPRSKHPTSPTAKPVESAIEKRKRSKAIVKTHDLSGLIISPTVPSEIDVALKPATPSLLEAAARRARPPNGRGETA